MAYQINDNNIVQLLEDYQATDMAPSDAETIEQLMRFAAQRIQQLEAELESALRWDE